MSAISVFVIIFILFIIIRNSKKTTATAKPTTMAIKKTKAKTTATVDEIPEAFIKFPEYPGVLLEKPILTTAKDYTRITMLYNDYINVNYLETLTAAGFEKANNVRYDKDNTYVIVEEIDDTTKIAFHIKTLENSNFNPIDSNPIDNNNPISF